MSVRHAAAVQLAGDELVEISAALASPVRVRILGRLAEGNEYVSRLARELGISRPLLHMHLRRLEAVGLIVGRLELSDDGKAMRYYAVADFDFRVTPDALAAAARTLTTEPPEEEA